MAVKYESVHWNRHKKIYDIVLWLAIMVMCLSFIGLHLALNPMVTIETLIIRTCSLVAIVLLHFILIIGPLCRLNSAFLPLLYNRRHLGVSMFLFAAIHGIFSIIQFHSLGDIHPIASIFLSNEHYNSISKFPFQILGFFALIILFLMAATSHDFWLKNLSPKVWKGLHMMVYVAYAMIILHIALGILQYETHPVYWVLLVAGFVLVSGIHLLSAYQEWRRIKVQKFQLREDNFFEVAAINEIPENCGKGIWLEHENIALFRYGTQISAVNNVCKHQQGPLSEGQVVDGCITCPWHGYQYRPKDGQSPPPFTEKIKTYQVKILKNKVWVNPNPLPEGTFVEPAIVKNNYE
ncbi:MAG: Rieske 2Fe-2S domain-containing protein [Bacteroidota bacterium]